MNTTIHYYDTDLTAGLRDALTRLKKSAQELTRHPAPKPAPQKHGGVYYFLRAIVQHFFPPKKQPPKKRNDIWAWRHTKDLLRVQYEATLLAGAHRQRARLCPVLA